MKRSIVLTCAAMTLAGCAGRDPIPVSAYSPNDPQMSCLEIDSEIRRNNLGLRARAQEVKNTTDRNIVVGAAGILLFWPALFAMDLKDAAGTEGISLEQRNSTLTQLAAKGGCQTVHAMTFAEAEAERVAAASSDREASEAAEVPPGVRTPTDQRLHRPDAGAQPAMQGASTQAAVPIGVDRATLKDLMDRFLRGEISKEEYDRLRAG